VFGLSAGRLEHDDQAGANTARYRPGWRDLAAPGLTRIWVGLTEDARRRNHLSAFGYREYSARDAKAASGHS